MFTLKAVVLPRKSAMRISTAFASGSAGAVGAAGGGAFSAQIAAGGRLSPANKTTTSDERDRIIGLYLFGSLVRDSTKGFPRGRFRYHRPDLCLDQGPLTKSPSPRFPPIGRLVGPTRLGIPGDEQPRSCLAGAKRCRPASLWSKE